MQKDMYFKKAKFIALSICASVSILCGVEGSHLSSDANSTNLGEIVVSASGFRQDIRQAPASISTLDNKEISSGSFTSLHDIANKMPGVSVIAGDDGPASGISIRGMESSQTLVLIDGKRVSSAAANPKGGAGDMNSNFIPPAGAIERIEVIRGPMSSLYGSDAVGGVINIITKKNFSKFSGSAAISTTIQDHEGIGDGKMGEAYVNIPFGQYAALQLWGYKKLRDEDGYKGGYQKSDKSDSNAKLWLTPDENNKFYVQTGRQNHDYSRTLGKTAVYPNARGLNHYKYKRENHGVGYLGEFESLSADISYFWDKTRRTSIFDSLSPAIVKNRNFNSKFTTYLGINTLTFGYDFSKQDVQTTFIVSNANRQNLRSPQRFSMNEHAGFLEDEIEILENTLFLTLGGRLTHNEYFGNHFSPRAYATFNIGDTWTIKGGVATGYKTPNVNQISPEVGTIQGGWRIIDFGNKDLKPEKSTTYEIGLYYDNADDLRGNITLFKNDFKDKILDTDGSNINRIPAYGGCAGAPSVNCPGWGTYFNIEGAEVYGVELSGDYDITKRLNFKANYTYSHSEIETGDPTIYTPNGAVKFSQTNLSRLDGKSLTATPKHAAHATLSYRPIAPLSTFIGLNYESDLTSVQFGPGNRVSKNDKKLFTTDLGAQYDLNNNLSLNLTAYNIFDNVRYDEGLADDGNYYWYPEEGRRFWFKVNAKW